MSKRTRNGGVAAKGLALCIAVSIGVAAGVFWHEPVTRALGIGRNKGTGPRPSQPEQLWTCSMHPQVREPKQGLCPICHMQLTPLKSGGDRGPAADGIVTINPVVVQNMGIRTAIVGRAPLGATVTAAGEFREREPDRVDVNLRVGGWIEALHANYDGMRVNQGDPLFDLSSPELTLAIEELIGARRAMVGGTGEGGGGGVEGERSLHASARAKLIRLGLTAEQTDRMESLDAAPRAVTFLSPITGNVTEKIEIYAGSAVQAGERVMRIVNPTVLWLDARVPEGDLAWVRVGQRADVSVPTYPGEAFAGDVMFVHPRLDVTTRTALVRMDIPNQELRLREGMYASARFHARGEPVVVVPREAIIDTGERQVAFVVVGEGKFEPRELRLGAAGDGGLVEVLSGLAEGDMVVVSGQFLLDSESRLREGLRKMTEGEKGVESALPALPAPTPGLQERLDAVYSAYMPMAAALGEVQQSETPLDPAPLVAAARALEQAAELDGDRLLAKPVLAGAEALAGQGISEQRERFKKLGEAMAALVSSRPPSSRVAPRVYLMHCPMAPGSWLQTTEGIANPFYADDMKECARIEKEIETKPAPDRGAGAPR